MELIIFYLVGCLLSFGLIMNDITKYKTLEEMPESCVAIAVATILSWIYFIVYMIIAIWEAIKEIHK